MAGLQERSGSFRIIFRFRGKQHAFTLGRISKEEAEAKSAQVDYLLLRIRQRLIELPPGADIVEFIQYDGNPAKLGETGDAAVTKTVTKSATLRLLRDRFLAAHAGSHEKNTLGTARIHFKHLTTTLGEAFLLSDLAQADLQRHIDRRHSSEVSAVTIRKEINGLRAAWNWARRASLVTHAWPGQGLVYPKTHEKPPFQTRAEIERQIARSRLKKERQKELWESLYLTADELAELLAYVATAARHPFIYPMVCMAAHTGARRSELLRAQLSDVDFEAGTVTIREKKRVRGRHTTRRLPLSPFLAGVLKEWLAAHPGGPHLFCLAGEVGRSKKRSRSTGYLNGKQRPTTAKGRLASVRERKQPGFLPLTENEAADHFARTLAGSKWENVPGWHCLRHSFISLCASRGIDQRLIQTWCGHMSAEMNARYTHLYPSTQQQAIRSVFG